MERLAFNRSGNTRREMLHGRPYLVVPMTLVVEGVLDGSQGPLYYPAEELEKDVEVWNGMPLVGYHPMKGGVPASARNPSVLEAQGLGFTFNTLFSSGKLQAEGWFDLELVDKFDRYLALNRRIRPRLEKNLPIELSTGLYVNQEPATPGSSFNGRPYFAVARRFRPDHVAVLPDAVGACSIKDGCGVLVNHQRLEGDIMALTAEQKKSFVDFLVANCACWNKQGDAAILNALPDDKLQELKEAAEAGLPKPPPKNPLLTPENVKELAELLKPHLIKDPSAPATPPPASPAPPVPPVPPVPSSGGGTPPVPPVPVAQPVTANEWLKSAPAEIRMVVENGMRLEQEQRRQLADRLVANVADVVQKQAMHALLMNKSVQELQMMATLLPPVQPRLPNLDFSLAPGGGSTVPSGYDPVNGSDQDMLLPPVINWGDRRKIPVKEKAGSTDDNN